MRQQIVRKGKKFKNQSLSLGEDSDVLIDCQFIGCHLRFINPASVLILGSTFCDTTLEMAKRNRKDFNGCFFDRCIFKGKYVDCRFGLAHEQTDLKAGLHDCDFTTACMNLCTFHNCTPDDFRVPGWPHVTILHPAKNGADFKDFSDNCILENIGNNLEVASPETVGIIYHLTSHIRLIQKSVIVLARVRQIRESCFIPPNLSLDGISKMLKGKSYVRL